MISVPSSTVAKTISNEAPGVPEGPVDGGSFTDEDMAYLPWHLEADSDLRKLDVALREQRIKGEPGKAMQVFCLLRTLQWVPT